MSILIFKLQCNNQFGILYESFIKNDIQIASAALRFHVRFVSILSLHVALSRAGY